MTAKTHHKEKDSVASGDHVMHDGAQPTFEIQRIYVKDLSFQAPNTPHTFVEEWKPHVQLNLNAKNIHVKDHVHEVVLSVSAHVTVNDKSAFVGPQIIPQVELFNLNPTGRRNKRKRLYEMMKPGGISDCGNAQNCVRVCPKNIPITDAIAAVGRDVSLQALKDLFSLPGYSQDD